MQWNQIINTSEVSLNIIFSDNPAFTFGQSQAQILIQNPSITVNGSVAITGPVTVEGSVNATVNGSVAITGTVSVDGSVNATVNGTVAITGPVTVEGSVNATVNGTVAITGTVTVEGSINATVNGTINVGSINTTASVNITESINLPTDIGTYSSDMQESQLSGTNTKTYNPWNFSTGSAYPVRTGVGVAWNQVNLQQTGAKGYILFNFYVYNGTSTTTSGNITVYLCKDLPTDFVNSNPPTQQYITSFTFNTGVINAGQAAWVTNINPNIQWEHDSLVVIPLTGGTSSNAFVVANGSAFNQIDSHYWSGSSWNQNDDGFIGFWFIINTAGASLPVNITGPVTTNGENSDEIITKQSITTGFGTTTIQNSPRSPYRYEIDGIYTYVNISAYNPGSANAEITINSLLCKIDQTSVPFGAYYSPVWSSTTSTLFTIPPLVSTSITIVVAVDLEGADLSAGSGSAAHYGYTLSQPLRVYSSQAIYAIVTTTLTSGTPSNIVITLEQTYRGRQVPL